MFNSYKMGKESQFFWANFWFCPNRIDTLPPPRNLSAISLFVKSLAHILATTWEVTGNSDNFCMFWTGHYCANLIITQTPFCNNWFSLPSTSNQSGDQYILARGGNVTFTTVSNIQRSLKSLIPPNIETKSSSCQSGSNKKIL